MSLLQNKTKILLIENDSEWLMNVYSELVDAGYSVSIATGGDEGFCAARRESPDLIVCETALPPDISSVELCYMIRADRYLQTTPLVLLGDAGDAENDFFSEGLRAGADACFEKNCDLPRFAAHVAALVERRRAEGENRVLNRTELYLAKISEVLMAENTDETPEPVADLTLALAGRSFDEYVIPGAEAAFDKAASPQRQNSKNVSVFVSSEGVAPFVEFAQISFETLRRSRRKVYYEMI